MDMRKFSSETFLKVDDVRDCPLQERIAVVKMGNFDRPDLVFENGDVLSLNATNNKILVRAYGPNSDDWIDKEIELFLGEIEYQKKMKESVIVRPVSPPLKRSAQTKPKEGDGAMTDDIPY